MNVDVMVIGAGPAGATAALLLARQGAGTGGPEALRIDSLLASTAATVAFVEEIDSAGPFGASAPAPRFAFANVAVSARRIGETHLKLSISDAGGPALDAIAFCAFEGPLGPALENAGHRRFHIAGKLELNHWNGRTRVQLRLDDAAPA